GDTAAQVTTLNEKVFKKAFHGLKLLPSDKTLVGFMDSCSAPLGKFEAEVLFGDKPAAKIDIYIVKEPGLSLHGIREMGAMDIRISTRQRTVFAVSPKESSSDPDLLNQLKKEFPSVFTNDVGTTPHYTHSIKLKPGTIPKRVKPRQVPLKKQEAVKIDLDENLKMGIIEKVEKSEWNSPIVAVNKPDGSVRITVDYSQTLNPQVIPSQYHLLRPEDIIRKARYAKVFSKIDLTKAYWHIPLDEKSKPLTAFVTESHGPLQFCKLPMGLTDSGASFQCAVEKALDGVENTSSYIDDILVWGRTQKEHDKALRAVFTRLRDYNFRVRGPKLVLSVQSIDMLGQLLTVTDSGLEIKPDPDRVKSILQIQALKDRKGLE
ncbi:MAG: RNA-directed DNA polymerase, partial [Gammaproteobacteria bacterium]|nr:RNA-directed DNA polymerase [Gammaproteobacteria bacterium]